MRTPYTARAKKIDRQFPSTPAAPSSQRPARQEPVPGPSTSSQSPLNNVRVRINVNDGSPGPSQRLRRFNQDVRGTKKHPQLPNFEDAFQTSSPLRGRIKAKDKGKEREHSRLSLFPPINDPDSMFTGSDPHSSPPASPPRPIKRLEFAVPDRPRSASVLQNLPIPQHDAENPFQDDADIAMMVEDDAPQSSQPTIPEEVLTEEAVEFECIDPKEEVKIYIYFFGYSLTLTCFSA